MVRKTARERNDARSDEENLTLSRRDYSRLVTAAAATVGVGGGLAGVSAGNTTQYTTDFSEYAP